VPKKISALTLLFYVLLAGLPAGARQAGAQPAGARAPVVLLSIDGLKPDYVIEADKHGLRIPNLRRLFLEGAHASGVIPAFPTVTYPNHATMVTGVSPSRHGILANTPFDPYGKNSDGWYWYAEDIRVPTLWDAARKAGLVTASVDWPVTVGANIEYNIVQYWRASTPDDLKAIRALSTPGLLAEAERAIGPFADGNDYTVAGDRRRAAFIRYVLEKKRPRFMTCYLGGLDTEEHSSGPYSPATFAALEEIDKLVGQIRSAAESVGAGRAIICVVSDHGFMRTDKVINVNAALREAGLIELDQKGKIKTWRAFAWYAGGSAAVMLANPNDEEARKKAGDALKRLASDKANGIERVLEGSELQKTGGFPTAAFVVSASAGYRLGNSFEGPVVTTGRSGGTHGYLPEMREMDASFFIAGPGVPAGRNLGRIDMRDVAPTLAGLLKVSLPTAEGRNLLNEGIRSR
jgi:predicted AlkP superfamily pyrophosphatase or phosphodiesterase